MSEVSVTLRFKDEAARDAFMGQLTDGFGEGYVSVTPKHNDDGTFDWNDCEVENTDPYSQYDETEEYEVSENEEAEILWRRNLED